MLNPSIYTWFPAYKSAVVETDLAQIPCRVREALRVIDDRLRDPAQIDDPEKRAIADAKIGLAKLEGKPVEEYNSHPRN
jgi:hypothetical protein